MLSLAVSHGWYLRQIDVQNAFLHGLLHEDVFMTQPFGFIYPQLPHHVCKLQRSLYGLRQALRVWFSRLTDQLQAIGFINCQADHSLNIYHQGSTLIYLLIYIDDIILAGTDM
jgi:hypothetical protein